MSWFDPNYVFAESSGNSTSTFIPESNVVVVPSGDYGFGCSGYEAGYGASYRQENDGNNFFVSDASYVQQDVGEPSYAQESLGDEPPAYPEVSYKTDQV
ncbi:hypothetical protein Hanom_Chr03g00248811 [Helianthus anomalus]